MSFLEMSEQKRIEALTSGINSVGLKAATLWSMERGTAYTQAELATRVWGFLGDRYANRNVPRQYCMLSLEPIGMVVKSALKGDMVITFEKTEDGFTYGNPSTARFLYVASELDLSLYNLNSSANTVGTVRHAYVVARILELLRDGRELRTKDISEQLDLSGPVIGRTLSDLGRKGLIEYDSVSYTGYEHSQMWWSPARLADKERLEFYIRNPEQLRADGRRLTASYRSWGQLSVILGLKAQQLQVDDIADRTGIPKNSISNAITVIIRLGIYQHDRFFAGHLMSSAKINYLGEFVYDNAYKPVLEIARYPELRDVQARFGEILANVDIHRLFRDEMQRYSAEKRKGEGSDTDSQVYKAVQMCTSRSEIEDVAFRVGEIVDELRVSGKDMNIYTVRDSLKRLIRDGRVESVLVNRGSGQVTRYRIKA